jgi:hypothetical protein
MPFRIRKAVSEEDFENYYRICFLLFKEKFYSNYNQSDDELFEIHRDELKKINFDDKSR